MFYDRELEFLRSILSGCHIRNYIAAGKDIDEFPDTKARTIYRVTDPFFCRYIFWELPECQEKKIFALGPYLNVDISRQQVMEQAERIGLPPNMFKELENFYATVPVIKEESHVFAMVNAFAEFIWEGSDNFESVEIDGENSAMEIIHQYESASDSARSDLEMMEKRYSFENELIAAVSQGNIHKGEQMMTSFSTLAFESRVSDPLRNIKNYCIIMNTLLRKAAESGGVHPIYLDRVSSNYAKQIENIYSVSAVTDFMLDIMRSYCNLVRKHSTKKYSPLIQSVIITIESDLTYDLSLSALADAANVSAGYLSGLFKKETGMTLTEYVNHKRISYAKHLLKSTGLQIQTIAQHCGILDFHYFCRLFKSITGKTPTDYRNNKTF